MPNWVGHLEIAMSGRAAGVNGGLCNSLVVEMGDLLAEGEILEERWTAVPEFQRILVIRNDDALIGRETPCAATAV